MKLKDKDVILGCILIYVLVIIVSGNTGTLLVKTARVLVFTAMSIYFFMNAKIYKGYSYFYILWGLVFLVYCIFGIRNAYSRTIAINSWFTLFYVLIINFIIYIYGLRKPKIIHPILIVFVISSILKALHTFIGNGFLAFLTTRRTDGVSANAIGLCCALSCVICFYFVKIMNKKSYNYYYAITGLFINLIFAVLSGSRKIFVYIFVPLAVFYILRSKKVTILIRNIIISLICVAVIYWAVMNIGFLYQIIGKRIETMIYGFTGNKNADGSTATRLMLISDGIKWFMKKPLWGYGIGNFSAIFEKTHRGFDTAYYAHNNYIELLVDCGLVGVIIYYFLHLKLLIKGILNVHNLSTLQCVLFGILVAILICDYGIVSYYSPILQLLIMINCLELNNNLYIKEE